MAALVQRACLHRRVTLPSPAHTPPSPRLARAGQAELAPPVCGSARTDAHAQRVRLDIGGGAAPRRRGRGQAAPRGEGGRRGLCAPLLQEGSGDGVGGGGNLLPKGDTIRSEISALRVRRSFERLRATAPEGSIGIRACAESLARKNTGDSRTPRLGLTGIRGPPLPKRGGGNKPALRARAPICGMVTGQRARVRGVCFCFRKLPGYMRIRES
eukprot:scaffold34936_cov90-Isochrysis_galbana.AAC.1